MHVKDAGPAFGIARFPYEKPQMPRASSGAGETGMPGLGGENVTIFQQVAETQLLLLK